MVVKISFFPPQIPRLQGDGNIDILTILIVPIHQHGMFFCLFMSFKISFKAREWAWWLMPVILVLWEAKWGRSLEVRSSSQPGQHSETPSLLKIQKLAGCTPLNQEVEVAVSRDHTTALQPEQQKETPSQFLKNVI